MRLKNNEIGSGKMKVVEIPYITVKLVASKLKGFK